MEPSVVSPGAAVEALEDGAENGSATLGWRFDDRCNVVGRRRGRIDRTGFRLLFRCSSRACTLAAFQFLEAELVVFLRLADRFLHLQKLEAHFFDTAVELPDLFLKLLNLIGFIGLNPHNRGLLRVDRAEATPAPNSGPETAVPLKPVQAASPSIPATTSFFISFVLP